MIQVRKSNERGHADHGWLDSHHTFSFADYYDPQNMGFRALRVINEDRVEPAQGFGTHGHRNMEILSYVLEGGLAHRDSTGGGGVIKPGDVQRMSAGTGVMHSEFNASRSEPVHFLQIWIVPERRGIAPGYEQKHFPPEQRQGQLRLIASPDAADGSVKIHQDARVYSTLLGKGQTVSHALATSRHAWVQVARGQVRVGDVVLSAGDGAAISDERSVTLTGDEPSEVLLFDLA
ncbi:MAG: pirin family protein [Myxococcaceae bacterium]|nr:MAG: pirin family protein [Myxococcaceae bacterium]